MIEHTENKALRIISFKQFMEPFKLLFNHLNKINNLMNKIMLNNIYVFDKLVKGHSMHSAKKLKKLKMI